MRRVKDGRTSRRGGEIFLSVVKLAFWRVRQSWGLLLLIGVGMITAIVLVCAIPLYAEAAMSAGLRQLFYANPPFSYISITGQSSYGSTSSDVLQEENTLNHDFQHHLQNTVSLPPQLLAQTSFPLLSIQGHGFPQPQYYNYALALNSFDVSRVMPHIKIVQGRFPRNNSNEIEIMLLPDLANRLGAKVGDVLTAPLYFSLIGAPDPHLPPLPQTLRFHLVGIFTVIDENDVFWHGLSFHMGYAIGTQRDTIIAQAIVSNPAFFTVYDDLQTQAAQHSATWNANLSLTWYYRLIPQHLSARHLDQLLSGLSLIERDVSDSVDQQLSSSVQNLQMLDPTTPLSQYQSRIVAVRIPAAIVSLFVLGLILYFVHLMAGLLVNLLAIGALVPFLLALLGNLIASWLSVRGRLTTFALLRALGCDPPRIAAILTIEQSITYLAALSLGLLLGYGLARLAVPRLIFTDAGSGSNSLSFFLAQSVPAPAIVIPGSLLVSLAIFLTLCLLTLAAMIYLASRPSIGQTLRLNQD